MGTFPGGEFDTDLGSAHANQELDGEVAKGPVLFLDGGDLLVARVATAREQDKESEVLEKVRWGQEGSEVPAVLAAR